MKNIGEIFFIFIRQLADLIFFMSGHSKWSTIKHDKAATDQKRGKMFSKLSRAISVAVKEGGSADPNANARLRLMIEQARAINMPKQNIQKAMEKGLGKEGAGTLESVTYEGFGPEKVAVVVECITDNKNRTGAEMRSFFERKGGGLAQPGAVTYLFKKRGLILIEKKGDSEEQILKLIDLGVEDVEESTNFVEVYTQPENLELTKIKIKEADFVIKEASLGFKATVLIPITQKGSAKKILAFLDELDEFDEVQKVYCNADFVGL